MCHGWRQEKDQSKARKDELTRKAPPPEPEVRPKESEPPRERTPEPVTAEEVLV